MPWPILGGAEPALSILELCIFQERPLSQDPVVVKLKAAAMESSGDGWGGRGGVLEEGVDLRFPHISERRNHLGVLSKSGSDYDEG